MTLTSAALILRCEEARFLGLDGICSVELVSDLEDFRVGLVCFRIFL